MAAASYIMNGLRAKASILVLALAASWLLAGCGGGDYTPVYFPPAEDEKEAPDPSVGAADMRCTLSFASQLCVTIKGENIEVGIDEDDRLCTEVPAFPIHITGSTATIEGSEFPDVEVEGHGLPAPITINARGDGDGKSNTGSGTIDSAGNISIEGFSLFIVALGIVGEVPNLTLTTGTTDELDHLPAISGSPPDASGAMTLVTATALGHIIDAADEYLLGASLTASFRGGITPGLAECGGGGGESTFEAHKVTISEDGQQTISALPEGNVMEASTGTFISEGSQDVGPRFESQAKFRVTNTSSKAQAIAVPPRKGPFHLSASRPLSGQIAPQQSFVLTVTFRPTLSDAQPGEIIETITIGPDAFQLSGVALTKSGAAEIDVVDGSGEISLPDVDDVEVGDAKVPANTERRFFMCQEIDCEGTTSYTSCTECPDPTNNPCVLMQISTEGEPMAEVDAQCSPAHPDAAPMYVIDLKGSAEVAIAGQKQVIALRNRGATDMTIQGISIEELDGSQSTGQFTLPEGAVFATDDFEKIHEEVAAALEGGQPQGTKLPLTLPPYQQGYSETAAYIVITYTPSDLLGSDGQQAGVGSEVTDKALLRISTDQGDLTAEVSGTTSIGETPALELYFKTGSGTRQVAEGSAFPFKDITQATVDAAVPVFLRVADTSSSTLRVTSVSVSGPDDANFRWLGTAGEIAAVNPPEGQGYRCSIPTVDEETGEIISEEFDLTPVALGAGGFDIAPGAYSTATMPLMGCVNFHMDPQGESKGLYEGAILIEAVELDAAGLPMKNPDGSERLTELSARLLAAIEPRTGRFVLRITQTSAAMLNPQFPGLSAISSFSDMKIANGGKEPAQADLQLFTGAMTLDPFDEMTIASNDGQSTLTGPNDGVTAIFRPVDTHPVSTDYAEEGLFDYASLIHDALLPEGERGVYEDYPGVPDDARINGWRIYTSTLSYPGPLAPPERVPENVTDCVVVNPCDPEDLKLFTEAGAGSGKGACAFFYASGGRYDSPAFHTAEEMAGGEYDNLCNNVDEPQALYDIDTGHYSVDGELTFEEIGLRFFGPTYFHNPGGPLGSKPPMDAVFHMAFTTGVLKPQADESDWNLVPDEKVDLAGGEYKINLNDPTLATPPICEQNTDNWIVGGEAYSKWRYLDGLLFKDEEATIPAGCPEDDNDHTGGQAFLRGKPIDPETGNVTFVGAAKFGSSDDLSFAFKDVMMFIVLKGWFCDPTGSEEDYEGARCFEATFNERDAASQQSIIRD